MENSHRVHYGTFYVRPIAIVLSRTQHGNLHAGIAHRTDKDHVFILHLAWDCAFLNEEARDPVMPDAFPCPIFVVPDVDDVARLELAAGICRRAWQARENKSISFSVSVYPDSIAYFDDQGIFRSTDPKIGVSCTTFVMKIFAKAKIPLILVDDWTARPEKDRPTQEMLIGVMEKTRAWQLDRAMETGETVTMTQEKIEFNKKQIGKPRVAPEEVAGACLEPNERLPASCSVCERNGEVIVSLLDRLQYSRRYAIPLLYVSSPAPPLNSPP